LAALKEMWDILESITGKLKEDVMALTETPVVQLGAAPPDFSLPGVDGKTYTLKDVQGPRGTLIMFICNHCPYVKAIISRIVEDVKVLQAKGIGVLAIMSNDTESYPQDSFDNMKKFAAENAFSFPYVIDKDQDIAKTYGAVCTPDFFGYNAHGALQYRGRLDEVSPARPATADTRKELLEAMIQIADTGKGPSHQVPSIGCNIKWKAA
jgi:peroxiredoxin